MHTTKKNKKHLINDHKTNKKSDHKRPSKQHFDLPDFRQEQKLDESVMVYSADALVRTVAISRRATELLAPRTAQHRPSKKESNPRPDIGHVAFQFDTVSIAPRPRISRVTLELEAPLTSTAGGVNAYVVGTDPSVAEDWASIVQLYQFYKTEALTVESQPVGLATVAGVPVAVISDWQNATALTAWTGAAGTSVDEYPDAVSFANTGDPWRHGLTVPKDGYPFNQWIPVTSAINVGYIKVYADGLAVSSTFARLLVKYQLILMERQ